MRDSLMRTLRNALVDRRRFLGKAAAAGAAFGAALLGAPQRTEALIASHCCDLCKASTGNCTWLCAQSYSNCHWYWECCYDDGCGLFTRHRCFECFYSACCADDCGPGASNTVCSKDIHQGNYTSESQCNDDRVDPNC